MLHAGCADGWIPTKSADNSDETNGDHFFEWWERNLLPKLPSGSVIMMNSAPYHSMQSENSVPPRTNWKKDAIRRWLAAHQIAWCEDMLKAELLELVNQN